MDAFSQPIGVKGNEIVLFEIKIVVSQALAEVSW